jgi:CMP-N-acetylneuraminic acid synthetase
MVLMTKTIVGIIPARGGSKSIPKKNIVQFGGKPLIAWTILAALKSKYISKTVVSSDDDEILSIARSYNAGCIKRPAEFSLDESPSEPLILHAMNFLVKEGDNFDYIMLLQPTSPLRNSKHIDKAAEELFGSKATALISTLEINNKYLKSFIVNEKGYIQSILHKNYAFNRRQDLPRLFLSNGAIYLIETKEFLKNNSLITDKTISYPMDETESIDIDTKEDLLEAEKFLSLL